MVEIYESIHNIRETVSENKKLSLLVLALVAFLIVYLVSPYYVMFIVGTSMEPEIEHHDILLASEAREPQVGDTVDVSNENDSVPYDIVHKVVMVNETHIQTKGVNRTFPDVPTRKENVQGEVIYVLSPPEYVKSLYKPFIPDTYAELEEQYS